MRLWMRRFRIKRSPCKGCEPPKRTITCHGFCKEYKQWKTEHDEMMAEQVKERNKANILAKKRKRQY